MESLPTAVSSGLGGDEDEDEDEGVAALQRLIQHSIRLWASYVGFMVPSMFSEETNKG